MVSLVDFFRLPQYRNKYVLRREARHPGNSYTVVFATRETLESFAASSWRRR
jgi:hypothetical protein